MKRLSVLLATLLAWASVASAQTTVETPPNITDSGKRAVSVLCEDTGTGTQCTTVGPGNPLDIGVPIGTFLPVNIGEVAGVAVANNGTGSMVAASEVAVASPTTIPSHFKVVGGQLLTAAAPPEFDVISVVEPGSVSTAGQRAVLVAGGDEDSGPTFNLLPIHVDGHNPSTADTGVAVSGKTAGGAYHPIEVDAAGMLIIRGQHDNGLPDALGSHITIGGFNTSNQAKNMSITDAGRLVSAGESEGTTTIGNYISGRFDTNTDCSGACVFPVDLSVQLGTSWCEGASTGACHRCTVWNVGNVNAMEVKFGASANDPIQIDPDGSTTPTMVDSGEYFVGDGVVTEVFLDDIGATSNDTTVQYLCVY